VISFGRQSPELRRTANRHRSFFRSHEPFALQGVEVLPDRHRRQPEALRELRRIDWTLGFQQFGDSATSLPLTWRLHSNTHSNYF
jgi:hypothetical protein